jgi:hypothetical protein
LVQRFLEREPPLFSKEIEETRALKLEISNLRQQNKVLYKQNSDYRELLQEYKACHEKANGGMENIKAIKETLEMVVQDITDIEIYEIAKNGVRRAERTARRDWKRFVDENAVMGVDVNEVEKAVTMEDAMEITVYPYQGRNII